MQTTEIDKQTREAEIEAIKQVVATVQHTTQNELAETGDCPQQWRLVACQNTGVLD